MRLSLNADSAAYGAIAIARAEALLRGRPDSLTWFGRSRWGYGSWIGWGGWLRDSSGAAVALDSLGLSLATGAWFTDSGAVIALLDSGVTLRGFTLRNRTGPGAVTVDGHWPFTGPAALDGSIEGLQVPDLFVLAQRSPDDVSGEISGTFQLRGTAESPQLDLSAGLRGGGYGSFTAPLTRLRLTYRDQRVDGEVELRRLGAPLLSVTAALPLDLALVRVERRRLPGSVSIRARADSVDLSLVEAMVPQVERLAGTFDAEFGIEGTWEDPRLTGTLGLRNGSATFPALGVRHEAMSGALRLSGDTIYVDSVFVRSGPGSARVTGFVRLEELSRPVLGLRIDGSEFHTIDIRNYLSLTTTATVRLEGPLYQARLTGSGTATRGVLYFADLFTKNIVNLEDSLFAEFVDTALVRSEGLGAAFQSRFLDSLRIDSLRVDMGQEFWLRSTEANVQLAGNVFVSKDRRRYRFDGTLEAPRGTYRLQLALGTSRDFRVTRGLIRYLGTPDLNADLDIDAQHILRSVTGGRDTVFVHIGGTLYDPRLRLSSNFQPPLSEPEIIGYLLFGSPRQAQGTSAQGFESLMLTQWLSTTVSGQIEYALISDLGVPLDYLQIRPTTSRSGLTGAEVAIGKQFELLGTTAFLTASPRICHYQAQSLASVGASLEFRLSQQWLIAASVDPLFSCENPTAPSAGSYQFGADLFWEKRY
ncbi:MAG: translocation/assembly module TamB domain-containing protein [Gemmatimonadales bacterium]|nr:translocation/assembly module TamB domain-containing protein [Gemmatimonadales bacterium]